MEHRIIPRSDLIGLGFTGPLFYTATLLAYNQLRLFCSVLPADFFSFPFPFSFPLPFPFHPPFPFSLPFSFPSLPVLFPLFFFFSSPHPFKSSLLENQGDHLEKKKTSNKTPPFPFFSSSITISGNFWTHHNNDIRRCVALMICLHVGFQEGYQVWLIFFRTFRSQMSLQNDEKRDKALFFFTRQELHSYHTCPLPFLYFFRSQQ